MRGAFFALAIVLALAGCGRRGTPTRPGPATDVTYRHVYPAE